MWSTVHYQHPYSIVRNIDTDKYFLYCVNPEVAGCKGVGNKQGYDTREQAKEVINKYTRTPQRKKT